jgi:hypothetical protein
MLVSLPGVRMTALRLSIVGALALTASVCAFAQTGGDQCILAGRLGDTGWAPRMQGVQLMGADGRVIASADKHTLAGVKQARLSAPALLSRCDGAAELALGPDTPGPKQAVPAVGPGVVTVEAVNFPKLRRGGELVELKLSVPAALVTLVTR